MNMAIIFRRNDTFKGQAIDLSLELQSLGFKGSNLRSKFIETLFALSLEDGIVSVTPANQDIRNIVFRYPLPFIVKREAVVFHIVEPDALRHAATGQEKYGGRDTGVGFEDAAGHRDHTIQTIFLDQFLARFHMCPAGTKEDTIWHDHGRSATHIQGTHDQMEEKEF